MNKEYNLSPEQYDYIFRQLEDRVSGGLSQEDADKLAVSVHVLDSPSKRVVNCRCYLRRKVWHVMFEDALVAMDLDLNG